MLPRLSVGGLAESGSVLVVGRGGGGARGVSGECYNKCERVTQGRLLIVRILLIAVLVPVLVVRLLSLTKEVAQVVRHVPELRGRPEREGSRSAASEGDIGVVDAASRKGRWSGANSE